MSQLTCPPTYTPPPIHQRIRPPPRNLSTISPRTKHKDDTTATLLLNKKREWCVQKQETLSTVRCVFTSTLLAHVQTLMVNPGLKRKLKSGSLVSSTGFFSLLSSHCMFSHYDSPSRMIGRASRENVLHLLFICCILHSWLLLVN